MVQFKDVVEDPWEALRLFELCLLDELDVWPPAPLVEPPGLVGLLGETPEGRG